MIETTTSATTKRIRPTVWVKKIVLYKSISPVEEIRTIPFSQGMNIIQGVSNDSTEAFESGHGNGKTTLCRLIRYCLGEKSFGQEHLVAEVKHCFPAGYVGAVIEVAGEEWSVVRSLGHRGKDTAKQGVTLTELLAATDALPFGEFMKRVQEAGLAKLQRRDVLSGGQSIQWLHLLALCSRDQESRYDRFWNCRHVRSDSGSPKVTKSDVSLCVRAMLGLLDLDEPKLRNRLDELDAELIKLHDAIKEKRAEPTFHITSLRTALADELGVSGARDASLEQDQLFGINQATEARLQALRAELAEIEEKIAPLDRQINMATVQYRELLELQEQQQAASEATGDGTTVLENDLANLRNRRDELLSRAVTECKPGRILFGDCESVKAHLADLGRQITEEQAKTLPQVSSRDQTASHLADQAQRKNDPLNRLREKLDQLNGEKNDLLERRRSVNYLLKRVPLITADLVKWHRIIKGEVENTELAALEKSEAKKVKEQTRIKAQLGELLAKQNERAKQFGRRFHGIVQQTINASFKGTVVVEDDGMSFRINRERSLAGEAYETLAILLADVSILVESSVDSVCHPGLLIHDSPREADLFVRLYERMLDVAFSLMRDEEGNMPFQYIVTTTTRPSQQLQTPDVTKVTLSSGSGSLFSMQLDVGAGEEQKPLFDATEDQ
jgi:uncharacterized protein YydD (DUF2326 family)